MVECWMVFERLFDQDNKRVHNGPDTVHLFASAGEADKFVATLVSLNPTLDAMDRPVWVDPETERVFIKEGV